MNENSFSMEEAEIVNGLSALRIRSNLVSPQSDDGRSFLTIDRSVESRHLNSTVSVSENNMSLPSVEPSFEGSEIPRSPSQSPASSNGVLQDQSLSPSPSRSPSPPSLESEEPNKLLNENEEADELSEVESQQDNEEEVEEEDDDDVSLDSSPLVRKGSALPPIQEASRLPFNPRRQLPKRQSMDPSETVIASRVKNMAVTDSAVKSFASHRSALTAVPVSKNTVNSKLTLKEQSAFIDKLQKDNWGYQLKIYILQEELDKRSEDSVRDLRNENIEFKSINVGLNIEIKKLNRKIADLENRLGSLREREQDKTLENQIESLRDELQNCLAVNSDLTAQLEDMKDFAAELQARERAYKEELEELELREKSYREQLAGPGNESVLEDEIKEHRAREESQKEVTELRAELLRVRRSASTAGDRDSEISKLRQENRDLRRELRTQTSIAESGNAENERVYRELDDYKRSFLRSSSSAASRRSFVTNSDDYDSAISELRERVSEVKLVARERKMQVDLLNKENSDLQDVIESLQATIQNLSDDKASLESDVAQLLKEGATREEEIMTWQEDYEVLSTEADAELTRLSDLVKAKDSELIKLRTEIDTFTRLVTAVEQESEHLKDDVKEYQKRCEQLQGQLNTLRSETETRLRASQDETARERERVNTLRRQLEEARDSAAGRDHAVAEYEKAVEELESHLGNLQRANDERESTMAALQKKLSEMQERDAGLEKTLSDMQQRNSALEKKISALQEQNAELEKNSLPIGTLQQQNTMSGKGSINEFLSSTGSLSAGSDKWMIRLQELEQRLKAEREARIRDRDGARQRLDEVMRESEDLRSALAKSRGRATGTFGTLLPGAFVRSFAQPENHVAREVEPDVDDVES